MNPNLSNSRGVRLLLIKVLLPKEELQTLLLDEMKAIEEEADNTEV